MLEERTIKLTVDQHADGTRTWIADDVTPLTRNGNELWAQVTDGLVTGWARLMGQKEDC